MKKNARDQLAVAAEARLMPTQKPFRNSANILKLSIVHDGSSSSLLAVLCGGMRRRGGKHLLLNAVEVR